VESAFGAEFPAGFGAGDVSIAPSSSPSSQFGFFAVVALVLTAGGDFFASVVVDPSVAGCLVAGRVDAVFG